MTAVGWQRVEGGMALVGALAVVAALSVFAPLWPWWGLALLFLAPDLGMLGYLAGPRLGAVTYNALHLYGAGLILMALGLTAGLAMATAAGALWVAHVGFDRMLGYGLKGAGGFTCTHLGRIGRRDAQ